MSLASLGGRVFFFFFFPFPNAPKLELVIAGNDPVNAGDLGRLLSALSEDYEAYSGSKLAIVGFEEGSLVTFLADATDLVNAAGQLAGSIMTLAGFAKLIQQTLSGEPKEDERAVVRAEVAENAFRSAEAFAKFAMDSGRQVRLAVTVDGETTIEVEVAAASARAALKQVRARRRKASRKLRPLERAHHQAADGLDRIAYELAQTAQGGDSDATAEVVKLICSALAEQGLTDHLGSLASRLEDHGRADLAAIVREQTGKSRGRTDRS